MAPLTIEEFNKTTASNYEKHFFQLCVERKIYSWINNHHLVGFKPPVETRAGNCPTAELPIDINTEKDKEDDE
jgi:hypothetical protein